MPEAVTRYAEVETGLLLASVGNFRPVSPEVSSRPFFWRCENESSPIRSNLPDDPG